MSKDCGAVRDDRTQLRPNSRSQQVKLGSMMLAASVLIPVSHPQERVDRFALHAATRKHAPRQRRPNGISGFRPSLSATKSAKMDLRGRGASSDIWS